MNACSRLTLCNRCSVPIICWQTYCCMAVGRFGVVTSTGPELHASEKRQPIEKKQTLCASRLFSGTERYVIGMSSSSTISHESQAFNLVCKQPTPNHFHLIFFQSHQSEHCTTVCTATRVLHTVKLISSAHIALKVVQISCMPIISIC